MLVFPQLTTGAAALYPVRNVSIARTVMNAYLDGGRTAWSDADAATIGWELDAKGLTRAEWDAIEQLFQLCGGAYRSFTMLDPTGNLLAQSEGFDTNPWVRGPMIQMITGVADPFGGISAIRVVNSGQAADAVTQTLGAPGNFQYCFSVWARSVNASAFGLGIGASKQTFTACSAWQRFYMSTNPGQAADTIAFAIDLPAGSYIEFFGAQAEAQLAPSDYKKTGVRGGVYTARFASDELKSTAVSTDVFDAKIRIVSVKG